MKPLFVRPSFVLPRRAGVTLALCLGLLRAAFAGEVSSEPDKVIPSPQGTFQIQEWRAKEGDFWTTTAWIVPTAALGQRIKLDAPYGDENSRTFHISPDEQWIFAIVHFHSHLDGSVLYHRKTGFVFENVAAYDDTDSGPNWKWDGGEESIPDNELDDSDRSYTRFVAWSPDSARLLVKLVTGQRIRREDYFYYNLRRGVRERTPYLRSLRSVVKQGAPAKELRLAASAEPLDPLPPEAELRTRYEFAEFQLKKSSSECAKVCAKLDDARAKTKELQAGQRDWIRAREAGAEAFSATGSNSERTSRRLQFLLDATEQQVSALQYYASRLKDELPESAKAEQ